MLLQGVQSSVNAAQSVTLKRGLSRGIGPSQKDKPPSMTPESRLIAQKLEAILLGMERKVNGRNVPAGSDHHANRRADLQKLHDQVHKHGLDFVGTVLD